MTFNDTQPGDAITITVHSGNKKLSLESKIINIVDESLVVEPFIVNGSMLTFPPVYDIELLVTHSDQTPYFWQKVSINPIVFHNQNCHVITTKLPGIKFNRRNNFRVYIGENGQLVDSKGEKYSVIVKDLSNSGFAFCISKDIEVEMQKIVTLSFTDKEHQRYFELAGRPIRRYEIDHYMVYGCIMIKRYVELENYLAQKQMEHRMNNRPNYEA